MTLTRRQLFATLAAAVTAPFLPAPPPVVWKDRLWAFPSPRQVAFLPHDGYAGWIRLNQTYYCEHPGKSARITGIDR